MRPADPNNAGVRQRWKCVLTPGRAGVFAAPRGAAISLKKHRVYRLWAPHAPSGRLQPARAAGGIYALSPPLPACRWPRGILVSPAAPGTLTLLWTEPGTQPFAFFVDALEVSRSELEQRVSATPVQRQLFPRGTP